MIWVKLFYHCCQQRSNIDHANRRILQQIGATRRVAMDRCFGVGFLYQAASCGIVGLYMNGSSDKITKPPAAPVAVWLKRNQVDATGLVEKMLTPSHLVDAIPIIIAIFFQPR